MTVITFEFSNVQNEFKHKNFTGRHVELAPAVILSENVKVERNLVSNHQKFHIEKLSKTKKFDSKQAEIYYT